MKRIVITLWVILVATALISCNNQSNNSATNSQTNTESSEPAIAITESSEPAIAMREEPKSNPIDKFVGRYSIKDGGPNVVEVFPDGRIIYDNVGEKRFLGNINIISDNAFMISSTNRLEVIYVNDGTPKYRISDGVERNGEYVGGGLYISYLVYDISERRIYCEGYTKYLNRDISEVRYFKMIR